MLTSDFDYDLPKNLIAQVPPEKRDESRLLELNRQNNSLEHHSFKSILSILKEDDLLVFNDTKVIHARLKGNRETGGRVEIFLLEPTPGKNNEQIWSALIKPARKLKVGEVIRFSNRLSAEILEKKITGIQKIRLKFQGDLFALLEDLGDLPLPPYIQSDKLSDAQKSHYQSIFAKTPGAVAAPTASLHFSEALKEKISAKGINTAMLTMHVGYGTFQAITSNNIAEHTMHTERGYIDPLVADKINAHQKEGKRIIAIGTTVARALEAMWGDRGLKSGPFKTNIFISPGYQFKVIGGLLTNFHLPKSSLIVLVSALVGRETVLAAYKEAIKQKYRFYSYGDAMLILLR